MFMIKKGEGRLTNHNEFCLITIHQFTFFFFRSGQHETLNIFNFNDPVNFCLLVSQSESSIRQFKKCQHDELVLYIIYRKILSGALN